MNKILYVQTMKADSLANILECSQQGGTAIIEDKTPSIQPPYKGNHTARLESTGDEVEVYLAKKVKGKLVHEKVLVLDYSEILDLYLLFKYTVEDTNILDKFYLDKYVLDNQAKD